MINGDIVKILTDDISVFNKFDTYNVMIFLYVPEQKEGIINCIYDGIRYNSINNLKLLIEQDIDFCISSNKKFTINAVNSCQILFIYDTDDKKCYRFDTFRKKRMMATFAIVDFNTSKLTNALIKSILNNIKNFEYNIIIFDNSDKQKFILDKSISNKCHDIIIYDNSRGNIIKFDPLIEKYVTDKEIGRANNYGSFKHTVTIDYMLTKIPEVYDNVILCDSDIIIKKDIDFIDESVVSAGSIIPINYRNLDRLCPFLQYINKKMMSERKLRYFDPSWAYGCSTVFPYTDTGYSMLKDIRSKNLPFKNINIFDYCDHLGSASFVDSRRNRIDGFIRSHKEYIEESVCFFTSVDEKYMKFVLPYIYFANKFNCGSSFEIVVVCSDDKFEDLQRKAQKLSELIKCDILIRKPKTNCITASKIRFIEEPEIRCKYTYCGDIDILILENISHFHISQMELYGTIFDNVVRYNGNGRLSGLHFVKTTEYYHCTKKARCVDYQKYSDEAVLKLICEKSGLKFRPKTIGFTNFNVNRPDHGFHISQNRKPFWLESPMSIDIKLYHYKTLYRILKNREYIAVSKMFDDEFNNILTTAVEFIKTNKFNGHNPDDIAFPKSQKKYVIYTCQTGNYEKQITETITDTINFDYFYFTDNPNINVDKAWKIIDINSISWIFPEKIKNDNVRKARYIKTHPHLFFENYQRSIWIDANMQFIVSPLQFIKSIDKTCLFTTIKHPTRTCIYDEAVAVLKLGKDDKTIVDAEIDSLNHDMFPHNHGLVESGVIVRNHKNGLVISVMEQWWEMIEGYSRRDQLSFDYIRWKNQFPINLITHKQRCEVIKRINHK